MEGRLQFIHRNKVFTTSEDAKSYVDSLVKRNYISLLAEPMVLLYGKQYCKLQKNNFRKWTRR